MMTNVNVWDHVLSIAQIEKMSKSCLSGEGNVYKWSDFIHGREGKVRVVVPSPCKPLSAKLNFVQHVDVAIISNASQCNDR